MARMTLDELVSQLRAAYGTALRSVVLYGSAAAGEHIAKRSDYNVLVIVDALDASRLRRRVGGVARVGGRGQSGAAHADDERNGAARRTSSRWSTRTFSSDTACCTAIRRSTGSRVDLQGPAAAARAGGDGEADQAAPGRAGGGQRGRAAARASCRERERDHDHVSRVSSHARRASRRPTTSRSPRRWRSRARLRRERRSRASIRHVRGETHAQGGLTPTAMLAGYLRGMEQLVALSRSGTSASRAESVTIATP